MKLNKLLICLGCFLSITVSLSFGQAAQDSRITGSYMGAVLPHFGGYSAALFGFALEYNRAGYHEASNARGNLFYFGRRYPITMSMVVPPFPDQKNRDIDFVMGNTDVGWTCVGTMFYGKFAALYLKDTKVTYQGLGAVASTLIGSELTDVEAGRVSTLVVTDTARLTRVKIRR